MRAVSQRVFGGPESWRSSRSTDRTPGPAKRSSQDAVDAARLSETGRVTGKLVLTR